MTIQQLSRNLSAINIETVAIDAVKETKENIADLNVLQMNRGLRSDGKDIKPGYSDLTVQIKKEQGQIFDHVTLRDTGAFQTAMYTEVKGLSIITGSADSKSAKLEKKYSRKTSSIFGLSEKFKNEYIGESLRPRFLTDIKELIFKK